MSDTPASGGRYARDPATGALTLEEPPTRSDAALGVPSDSPAGATAAEPPIEPPDERS